MPRQTARQIALADHSDGRRQVLRDEIRDAIKEAIFSGELSPGDRIIETTWANRLDVSQGPVREAIRDLEGIGLVETIPYKGSHVRVLSQKDIHDNYSVRICLESKSIADAIELLGDEEMKNLSAQMEKILKNMEVCANKGDLRNFTEYDSLFHRAIIDATGNPVLLRLWEQCNMRSWFRFSALTDIDNLKRLTNEHIRIADAIGKRDTKLATEVLNQHLQKVMHEYIIEESPVNSGK